jgi:hypothetical protein
VISTGGPAAAVRSAAGIAVPDPDLPKPVLEMLPDFIIGYETMARQAVPGAGKSGAEAVYQTLSMNLDMLTKVSTYARVQGFDGADAARREMDELFDAFPVGRADVRLGSRVVSAGYSADRGAYVMAWTDGAYMTYVKSFFKDNTPAQKRDFLYQESSKIALAVAVYQRTGKQGVEGSVESRSEASRTPAPPSEAPAP